VDPGSLAEVLFRLGTVKNPVLFTSTLFSSVMMWHGKGLVENPNIFPEVTGAGMMILSVLVFLIGVGFYAYAFLHLPSSVQELMFLQDGKAAVERHEKTGRSRRRRETRLASLGGAPTQ
jgi:hypothetical protein